MLKISINIPFWESVRERTENIYFIRHHLEKFKSFLNKNGVICDLNVFDFSENNVIPNSIHIPFPPRSFRKSEKINHILQYNCDNICPDIYCQFDSDIFFDSEMFPKLLNIIKNFDYNKFYVSDVYDIPMSHRHMIDYTNNQIPNNIPLSKRYVYGLGGTYLVSFDKIYEIGGYDERFRYWGGEDDDIANRLVRFGLSRYDYDCKLYHLPHPNSITHLDQPTEEYEKRIEKVYSDYSIYRGTMLNEYIKPRNI